jgi:MoxR-like ATPase
MSSAIQDLESLLRQELGRVVVGAETSIRAIIIALIARGHVLVEGVPGLGKTLLAKTLARTLGGEFKRIQGTPDLMPSDIIGVHVYDETQRNFVFRPGPLFADVVLVDEINRAGPKTQSALLEAMEERQVSVEREVFGLPPDFLVLATQNPREFEGTYPLPESQLDRFMLRINVSYPERAAEAEILTRYGGMQTAMQTTLESVATLESSLIQGARAEADHPRLSLGLSTRGALALVKAARVTAGLRGSEFAAPDDVKEAAAFVIPHRLVLTPEAVLEGMSDSAVVASLLADTAVPR